MNRLKGLLGTTNPKVENENEDGIIGEGRLKNFPLLRDTDSYNNS
jgi:hypothetical protein